MNTKLEQLKEYAKIIKDTPYALKTYLKTYDNTQKKFVPLELFSDQIQLLSDYEAYNENITKKYRQAGVSTVTAAWLSKKLQVAKPSNPEKVLIIANKKDTAVEMANKVRAFLEQWPSWMNVGFSPDKNSESRFRLKNGCEVKAVATSGDALRGYTPTILVFDEAAYIEAGDDFWSASMASLSCVHENSYILTDGGLIQLKDIIKEKEKIGFTDYDGDLKVINHNLKITDIKSTFKSEKARCYKIKTRFGFELIGSYKHPLLVNENELDNWVWMENLKIGDQIKIQYNQCLFGEDKIIDFHKDNNDLLKPLPEKLSKDTDLCYLMGLFLGKGKYNENGVSISTGNSSIQSFLLNYGFKKTDEYDFQYDSLYLKSFFSDYIGIDGVKIPSVILRSSESVIVNFLQGLFDANNYFFKNGIIYSTLSKELSQQLQIILSNFGIKTYIKECKSIDTLNDVEVNKFKLFIKNNDVLKFYDKIGFRIKEKQKRRKYINNELFDDVNENFYYDSITSIESFEDYTYDLEIPDGNSFISNSIISHNTGGKIILISCVTKETFVFTDKGLQQVKDFIKPNEEIGVGYYTEDYSVLGKNKVRTSNIVLNNGKHKTLKLTTNYSKLEGSENHKIWGFSNDKYDWYKLNELNVGDYINVGYGFDIWGNNDDFNPLLDDSTTNKITEEFCYDIGQFLSKNISRRKKINEEFKQKLKDIGFDLSLNVNERIIPSRLLQMSKVNIIHLLKGIFDGNGFINKKQNKIEFKLSSLELIEQVRMLLINLGILTEFKYNDVEFGCHKIFATNVFAEKFINIIQFKNEENNKNCTQDIIPNGSLIIKNLLKKYKIKRTDLTDKSKSIHNKLKKTNNLSRSLFNDIINEIKFISDDFNEDFILDKIFIENSNWDRINSIDESINDTFDFSLYNDDDDFWCHSIYYNGILGHQTPNGHDQIYHAVYEQALKNVNNFHITDLRWFKDPRYSKDLRWVKCNDIVHYMLNRDLYNDDEIIIYDFDINKYKEYEEMGYKPYSSWFENMCKKFKYDRRKISQELECVSGTTPIIVKNKITNEIKEINIGDLYNEL